MDSKNIRISDMKKALKDPKVLEMIKKMDPRIAQMRDEDLEKVISGLDQRFDIFTEKFGDMTDDEVIELGIKQREEKLNNSGKTFSDIKLVDACKSLNLLKDYDMLKVLEKLNGGSTLLTAEKKLFQTAFDQVLKVKDNMLYIYKLTDSTPDHIVLTLIQVSRMIPDLFEIIFKQNIEKHAFLYEDVNNCFENVEEFYAGYTEDEIIEQMKNSDLIQVNQK